MARRLLAWEEGLVGECRILLLFVTLQVAILDPWVWTPDPNNGNMMHDTYHRLTCDASHHVVVASDSFWHADVPLKVSLLVWQLLQNILLTKDNLCHKGVITADSQLFVTRCGNLETSTHLFLNCNFFFVQCGIW